MASIRSINMKDYEIIMKAVISEEEQKLLKEMRNILILPEEFDESLTTGKLGNSNRIMLPKKVLKKHSIELKGKVPAKIFAVNGRKFLLIKLEELKIGIPQFKD